MRSWAVALVFVVAAVVAQAQAKTLWHQLDGYTFEAYLAEFGKQYSESEHAVRRGIFEQRLAKIKRHNQDATKSWKEGVNHMTDWTESEFRSLLGYSKRLGHASRASEQVQQPRLQERRSMPQAYTPIDWRDHGIISDVKDQGQCGSCWTFAAAGAVESYYALKTGRLPVLSEQNILDCVPNPDQCGGTGGCQGGTAELAYDYFHKKGTGLASEWTYPYRSYFGENFPNCTDRPSASSVITGYTKLPSNQYDPLMKQLSSGPVAISVEASRWGAYESGIFDGCNQTNPDIDHAVLLVGFGTDPTTKDMYWLVKNSWSPEWGDKGYIRLKMTTDEETRCGTDLNPQDGSGCSGGPPTVHVCGTCGILYDTCVPTL